MKPYLLTERTIDRIRARPYIVRKWYDMCRIHDDDPLFFWFLLTFGSLWVIMFGICLIGFVCSLFGIYLW